jgi:pSer/pThr/pTyr-binding forkhead associated (FHA) protein
MTLQGSTFRGLTTGFAAGIFAWVCIDRTGIFNAVIRNPDGMSHSLHSMILQACLGGVYGMIVSACLTGTRQTRKGSWTPRVARQTAASGIMGFIAGAIGLSIGQICYNALYPPSQEIQPGPTHSQLLAGILARCAGWAVTGLFIGGAQGLARGSKNGLRDGLIGGVIGGLAGGSVFEAFDVIAANPSLARLAGFVFIGAAIGFFTEAVPVLLRKAWFVIEGPQMKHAEALLDSPSLTIGHSELADLRLLSDPEVAAVHCRVISKHGMVAVVPSDVRKYRAESNGGSEDASIAVQPVTVNGELIESTTALTGGDILGIGSYILQLRLRGQRVIPNVTPVPEPVPDRERIRLEKTTLMAAARPGVPLTEEEVGAVGSSHKLAGNGLSGTRLEGIQGPYYGQSFLLSSKTSVEIGRDPDCEISLPNDSSVSRTHGKVTLDTGRHYIVDFSSANGTFLNGSRLDPDVPTLLSVGDKIRVGDTVLEYQ